jgi:putative transposase
MPKIIRVRLTAEQRDDLNQRARARDVAPRLRERLEMVRLSDLGQTSPQIAQTLQLHEQTVRKYLTAFGAGGFAALPDRPLPGRPPTIRQADLDAIGQLLDAAAVRGETWTTPRLRHWLATTRGVHISTGRLGVLLRRERLRWKRTKPSVRHMQKDAALQDAATAHLESLIL